MRSPGGALWRQRVLALAAGGVMILSGLLLLGLRPALRAAATGRPDDESEGVALVAGTCHNLEVMSNAPPSAPASDRASSRTAVLVTVVLFLATLIGVFRAPLFSGLSLLAPDTPLELYAYTRAHFWELLPGGWMPSNLGYPIGPRSPGPASLLLQWWMDPQTYRFAAYMLNTIFVFLAAIWLLRGKGIGWRAATTAALAAAFIGQSFTIIAAGHLSKFAMMPFALLTLGCLNRAIARRSMFFYLLTGACAGMGLSEHMDVMFMFCLLCAGYGLYKLWECRPAQKVGAYWIRHATGLAAAAAVFFAVAFPTFETVFRVVAPARQAMTSAESGVADKWDYATSWSLPPEESLEFAVPSFFGIETGDSRAPYWGRLGRTTGWEQHHQGLMNLRQHHIYLGVLPLVFGVYAAAGVLRRRRRDASAVGVSAEARFWFWAWLACVLLAFGRYGGLYRLIYMIPVASAIRGPVKITQLVEVCTVVLFGLGLDLFLRECAAPVAGATASAKAKKSAPAAPRAAFLSRAAVVCGAAAGILLLAAVWVVIDQAGFFATWGSMGLGDFTGALLHHTVLALLRSAFFLIAAAVIVEVGRRRRGRSATVLACALSALVAIDMGLAAEKYVKTADISFLYGRSDLTDALQSLPPQSRVALIPGDPLPERMARGFAYHGIDTFALVGTQPPGEFMDFFQTLGRNPGRLWQVASAGYLFASTEAAKRLGGLHDVVLRGAFDFVPDGKGSYTFQRAAAAGRSQFLLLEITNALPRAAQFDDWRLVPPAGVSAALGDPGWDPTRTVLVEEAPGSLAAPSGGSAPGPCRPVAVTASDPEHVQMVATADRETILLLNDRFDAGWSVTVDGKPAPLLRCNGLMRGVFVQSGMRHIAMAYRSPYLGMMRTQYAAFGFILLLLPVRAVWLWRLRRGGLVRFACARRASLFF